MRNETIYSLNALVPYILPQLQRLSKAAIMTVIRV